MASPCVVAAFVLGLVAVSVMDRQSAGAVTTYDAGTDFAIGANPNGVWSYGYTQSLGGELSAFTTGQVSGCGMEQWAGGPESGEANVHHNQTGSTVSCAGFDWPPTTIALHPGSGGQQAVVRFIAPLAADFYVTAAFSTGDPGGDTTAYVLENSDSSSPLASGDGQGNPGTRFLGYVSLDTGDTLDFVIDPNGAYFSDNTFFEATITDAPDGDGDGHPSPYDCNDGDGSVHPGNTETVYNGKDDDCDADTLDDDLDGDGYGVESDCDDDDAARSPGLAETPYNSIDDDCNAATPDDDVDGDSFPVAIDCDDEDASVNPSAEEVLHNGKDDDCDPDTQDDRLENGDYVVGVRHPSWARGKIVRVRNGEQGDVCEPQAENPPFFNDGAYEAGFFNVPRELIVDARGRVVFLAYLGGSSDGANQGGWGLWRCDDVGSTPELLGAFGAEDPDYAHYPKPLGGRDVRQAHGLHLKVAKGVDLNDLTVATRQLYVFAVADDCCSGTSEHTTVAYDVNTGEWIVDNLVPPVPTAGYGLDMINANGYTFSANGGGVRAFFEPVRLDFQIGDFVGGLAFQSLVDLDHELIDSTALPNSDPGFCPPPVDGISNAAPYNEGGNFNVMAGFYGIAWADGLVLASDSVAAHDAFLPGFSLALLNYDPSDDRADMFHVPAFNCDVAKAPKYTPWNNSFWDSDGTPRGVLQMTPDGTAGTGGDKIVTLQQAEVTTIAEGLSYATGIDRYPGFIPPITGIAVFFEIHSPIDVLVMGPDGRRLGIDPDTGLAVNDYAAGGYDSETSEPHIYGIWAPIPGDFTIQAEGTGTGPYTVDVFGVNLTTDEVTHASHTGEATPGGTADHPVVIDSTGAVYDPDAPELCDGVDNNGDGAVDEGFPDSDGDEVADCADECPQDPNSSVEPCSGECAAGQCLDTDETCKACGRPVGNGAAPTASDALAILRTAIGARECAPCVCDVDGSGAVVATDALLTLKKAVGQAVDLSCSP